MKPGRKTNGHGLVGPVGGEGQDDLVRAVTAEDLADKLGMPAPVFVNLDANVVVEQSRALDAALSQQTARALPAP